MRCLQELSEAAAVDVLSGFVERACRGVFRGARDDCTSRSIIRAQDLPAAGAIKIDGTSTTRAGRGREGGELRRARTGQPDQTRRRYGGLHNVRQRKPLRRVPVPRRSREGAASFCERDKVFSDDLVFLCLDTYARRRTPTRSPSTPTDSRRPPFLADDREDATYDMIYRSASRITDEGWIAEIAVPFSSLRFPDREEQTWRVDFWRNRPRESQYQYHGPPMTARRIAGRASGERSPASRHQAEQGPRGAAGGRRARVGRSRRRRAVRERQDHGDVALGVAYDISSELRAEATVNPISARSRPTWRRST